MEFVRNSVRMDQSSHVDFSGYSHHSMALSNSQCALRGRGMADQPLSMHTGEPHAARASHAYNVTAAVALQKRKSDYTTSPTSAHAFQPRHYPWQKRRKSNNGPLLTVGPSPPLLSSHSGGTMGRYDATSPGSRPYLKASSLSWKNQNEPAMVLKSTVPGMSPDTQLGQVSFCACNLCMPPGLFQQIIGIPRMLLNETYLALQHSNPVNSPVGLQDLPAEIIHRVCDYLNQHDLGHFRCTTQKHATVGDEYLFRHGTLRLQLRPDHFDRLLAISKHPMICRRITRLELIGDEHGLSRLTFPESSWFDPEEKHRVYSGGLFQGCIRQLTNLEAIEMRVNSDQCPSMTPGIHYKMSEQMYCLLSDIQNVPVVNIKYLRIQGIGWQCPCCVGAHLIRDGLNLNVLESAAHRLLRLDLTINFPLQDARAAQCLPLVHYLHFARNIEELKLKFGRRGLPVSVDLGEICRLRWSHLRTLDLRHAAVLQRDLLSLLEAHSDLKELRLGSIILRGGRWTTAFESMTQSLTKLEKIRLGGILSDTRLHQTRTFLCGKSLNSFAHQAIVEKRHGGPIHYPPDPLALAQLVVRKEREIQEHRKAAGLSCDLCQTCGRLQHTPRL